MSLKYRSGERVSDSVGLLISMLVRYPEISSIYYEPIKKEIKFTFMLNNNKEDINSYCQMMNKCVNTFYYLETGQALNPVNIKYNVLGNITLIDIHRNIKHLSSNELNLLITLTQDYFQESIVVEMEELTKEDQVLQEDMIGNILENVKKEEITQRLIAFREEGRVLVYNK